MLAVENMRLDVPITEVSHLAGSHPADGSRISALPGGRGLVAHVLRDISLTLTPGTRAVLLGRNGSGKTMLMRSLAGVFPLTQGRRHAEGRLVSLLDSGFGLLHQLRGTDNIRITARFHGCRSRDMAAIVEDVAEFSDLGPFLHMPLRTYSSGMIMRLAFATAMAVKPDILLLDEWFFTADAEFLAKAKARLDETLGTRGILIMSTHALDVAQAWCTRAILMADGRIMADGASQDIISQYRMQAAE